MKGFCNVACQDVNQHDTKTNAVLSQQLPGYSWKQFGTTNETIARLSHCKHF